MVNEVNNPVEEQKDNASSAATVKTEEQPVETQTADKKTADAPAAETTTQSADDAVENAAEEDFGSILEKFEVDQNIYQTGDTVQGKVVEVSERGVLIYFGYKSEGLVPLDDFTSPDGEVTVKEGDEVMVVIKNIAVGDSPPTLSYTDARQNEAWDKLSKAFREDEIVTGKVTGKTKGGLTLDIHGLEGFLPSSLIDSRPAGNLDDYIGQELETKLIRLSRSKNNVVLSRKVLTDEVVNEQKAETMSRIAEGYVVEGTVSTLTEYGAFVDLGGIDGLLHITDMSWNRVNRASDLFKTGDTVQVKILKINKEKEKISLGYKQLIPDPWEAIEEVYLVGAKVKGRVSSVTEYGAFVELEPGIEGLVHISEMSWSKRIDRPKSVVSRNDEIEVQVLGIDTKEHRISLGMKQLMPHPWDEFITNYQVGDKIRGTVRGVTDFGVFVEVIEGVEGLVHISDITWSRKIKHPKEVLNRGQEVDAIITKIHPQGKKISLSIKDLTPSAWETFLATHKPGDVVKGKISRFTNFGVFVELGDELEGLCHISELSDERVDDPKKQFEIGQELDFKILRIEPDVQKIGLSHRAVGKEDEPELDTKVYSTEAKGGMASLGELAKLKFGGKTEEQEPETEPEVVSKKKAKKAKATAAAEEEAAGESPAAPPEETTEATEPAEEKTDTTEEISGEAAETNEAAENQTGEATTEETPAAESVDETVSENLEAATTKTAENADEKETAEKASAEDTSDAAESASAGTSAETLENVANEASADVSAEKTDSETNADETAEAVAEVTTAEDAASETNEDTKAESDSAATEQADSDKVGEEKQADEKTA